MWYCIACYCRNLSVCLYELHGFCGVVLFCLLGQNPLCLFCTNVCSALNSSWRYKSCVSWEIESEKQLLFIYSLPHSLLQLRGLFKETNLSSINSLIIITTCGVSTPLEFKSSAKWNMDKEENLFQIEERFIITSSKSLFKMHRKIPEISVDFRLHTSFLCSIPYFTFNDFSKQKVCSSIAVFQYRLLNSRIYNSPTCNSLSFKIYSVFPRFFGELTLVFLPDTTMFVA